METRDSGKSKEYKATPVSSEDRLSVSELEIVAKDAITGDLWALKRIARFYQYMNDYGRALIISTLAVLYGGPEDPDYDFFLNYVNTTQVSAITKKKLKKLILLQNFLKLGLEKNAEGNSYFSQLKKKLPDCEKEPFYYILLPLKLEKNATGENKKFPFDLIQLDILIKRSIKSVQSILINSCGFVSFSELSNIDTDLSDMDRETDIIATSNMAELSSLLPCLKQPLIPESDFFISIPMALTAVDQKKENDRMADEKLQQDYLEVSSKSSTDFIKKTASAAEEGNLNAIQGMALYLQSQKKYDIAMLLSALAVVYLGSKNPLSEKFYNYIKTCPVQPYELKILKRLYLKGLECENGEESFFEKFKKTNKFNEKFPLHFITRVIAVEMKKNKVGLDELYFNLPDLEAMLNDGMFKTLASYSSEALKEGNLEAKNLAGFLIDRAEKYATNYRLPKTVKLEFLNKDSDKKLVQKIAQRAFFSCEVKAILMMADYYQDIQEQGRALIFSMFACTLLAPSDKKYSKYFDYISQFESGRWLQSKIYNYILLKTFLIECLTDPNFKFSITDNFKKQNLFQAFTLTLKNFKISRLDSSQLDKVQSKITESFESCLLRECNCSKSDIQKHRSLPAVSQALSQQEVPYSDPHPGQEQHNTVPYAVAYPTPEDNITSCEASPFVLISTSVVTPAESKYTTAVMYPTLSVSQHNDVQPSYSVASTFAPAKPPETVSPPPSRSIGLVSSLGTFATKKYAVPKYECDYDSDEFEKAIEEPEKEKTVKKKPVETLPAVRLVTS